MGSWTPPTIADFKAKFFRDFPYAPTLDANNQEYVTDPDIANAITESLNEFNSDLFGSVATQIFLYLVAHILVVNIRNSSMGLNSQAKFPLESSAVGSVSLANKINDRFGQDPLFSSYLTTGYGKKYIDMAYPYTVGNIGTSCGQTTDA